ncbi:MAG: 2-oxoglutarate dehydrogenase, E2 component, dihydrolipoamide succinyltransferase [Gemmatimonadetes bacterium]|nr:MAG: 2-oxoglutarate dehydrogenase, E2 component, dihydrolipoamide succinyltransferase [Gemmatimonadota bacterium]
MARVDVLMPQMGESIAEGTLSKWLKKLGDEVKRDEPLFEISTDKVDAEIPAPNAGTLVEIKVQEGQTVPVQTLVAVIETDKVASSPPAPKPAPAPAATSPVPRAPSPVPPKGDGAETAEERLRRKSTPLVRKIAAEHQVDISTIPGTGFAGRVTKQDILGVIERGTAMPAAAPAGPVPRSPLPSVGPVAHPVVDPWPGDRVEPFSKIRKITADHMIMSRRISAHVTSFFEVDYSRVADLRRKHKAAYAERGVNLTYLAFIAKACGENLRKHSVVNAAVSGDTIIYRRDVNIGIAVALEWGLIVPVVKRADELSLSGLARAINDLGERARSKKLSPDEIQRGTFTITNPGVFGSYAGAPIINQPQVAILGVGAIEKRPKVVTLPDGTDTIAIRTMGMVSMSYDHRVVDGADADRFLADVKRALEDFPEGAI